MDSIRKETYSLPLYHTPLRYWGLRSDYVTDQDQIPSEDETRGNADETITITLREAQYGTNRIDVLHRRDDERLGTYGFEIVDEERRTCSYNNSNPESVPWPVRRALKRFGYHDRTTPETNRRYVFDHLISATRFLEQHANNADPLLEACISQFAGGIATFAFFSSFEHQLPEEAFNQVIEEFATNLENFRWWEDDVDESIFKYLYDIDAVTGPVYLPREDSYLWDGVDKSELPEAFFREEEEEKEEPVDDQGISIEMTKPEDSQYLFGSLVSRYAIDRCRFAKHDNNRLVLEHDGVPDLPPYGIIRSLQAQGYSLTNVPTFHPKDSLPELLKTIDELVQWVRKRYEPEHYKSLAAYSHYFYPLQEVVCLSALREADETEYNNTRDQFFEKYNISPESFPARQLDLQTVQTITREFIPLFGKEQFSAAERLFEEIQYEKRMHQLEKIAAESDDLNRPDEQLQKTQTHTHPHLWNK